MTRFQTTNTCIAHFRYVFNYICIFHISINNIPGCPMPGCPIATTAV